MINWQTLGLENPYPRIVAEFKAEPDVITSQLSPSDVKKVADELNVVYAVSCVKSNWTEVREPLRDAKGEMVETEDGDWAEDDNSGYELDGGVISQTFQLLEHHQWPDIGCLELAGICDEFHTHVEWDAGTKKITHIEVGHLY